LFLEIEDSDVGTNLDIDNLLGAVSDNFDATFLLAFIQCLELTFFLPVVHRSNNDLQESDDDLT